MAARLGRWVGRVATLVVAGAVLAAHGAAAAEKTAKADPGGRTGLRVQSIKDFGPTKKPKDAEATFKKALDALTRQNGGILVVPEDVPQAADLENMARWSRSINPASCKLRDWKVGPGVLVIDNRAGTFNLRVPQLGGLAHQRGGITLHRTMRLPPGDSLQHWTEESVLSIENNVVHGPCNYMEWLEEPVTAGKNRRFYMPTARNLFKGMYLNAHHGPGYRGPVARITVKDVGWDPQKKMHYFVADTTTDHVRGAMMQNKSHVPAIRVESNLNASNQTFDIYVRRNQYGNGDSYMFDAWFNYMGNVHSMPGDENGVCYVAYIKSDCNVFRGQVKSVDPKAGTLVFKRGRYAHTLANSRPVINLNPKKWLTAGTVIIVPPGDPTHPSEPIDEGTWTYQGKTYPSGVKRSKYKGLFLSFGGLIRGDKDCPWDASIVGRFFAVDEPSEYVEGAHGLVYRDLRRWYEICGVKKNGDGTKDIMIKRYWWGTKCAASPTLYSSVQ